MKENVFVEWRRRGLRSNDRVVVFFYNNVFYVHFLKERKKVIRERPKASHAFRKSRSPDVHDSACAREIWHLLTAHWK